MLTLFSAGRQGVIRWGNRDPADFCRETPVVFGAEAYRNSTGNLGLENSAGKSLPSGYCFEARLHERSEYSLEDQQALDLPLPEFSKIFCAALKCCPGE